MDQRSEPNRTRSRGVPNRSPAPRNTAATDFVGVFGLRNDGSVDGSSLISPRFTFNLGLNEDRTTQLRGGIGLFQGKNPAVWLSNAYSNAGSVGAINVSNPANCDTANVTVPVRAPYAIDAVDDATSSYTGRVAVANVLSNDTFKGAAATTAAAAAAPPPCL